MGLQLHVPVGCRWIQIQTYTTLNLHFKMQMKTICLFSFMLPFIHFFRRSSLRLPLARHNHSTDCWKLINFIVRNWNGFSARKALMVKVIRNGMQSCAQSNSMNNLWTKNAREKTTNNLLTLTSRHWPLFKLPHILHCEYGFFPRLISNSLASSASETGAAVVGVSA